MTTSRIPGQPCWFDVSVKDAPTREGLMEFLGGVFGWTFDVGPADTGHYTMALLDGSPVCAIGEQPEGMGQWVTYLHTPDIAETVARAGTLGAQVFMGPMQVMTSGTMALGMDPDGAVFGLWQPADFAGFEAYGHPGAPGWFDHQSPRPPVARDFYLGLFDLDFNEVHESGVGMLLSGGEMFASISSSPEQGMPAYWNPIIMVESVDDTERAAVARGATSLMSRMPVPGGLASAFSAPGTGTVITVFEQSAG